MKKDNKDFLTDLKNAGVRSTQDVKSLADVVGMPDAQDKEWIRKIILKYEKKHPGHIQKSVEDARKEMAEMSSAFHDVLEYGIVDKATNRKRVLELPEELGAMIEASYPTLFRDKKHLRWFLKEFPELRLPRKVQ